MGAQVYRYHAAAVSDWKYSFGRGWVATVKAPFMRHRYGDVVLIDTALPGHLMTTVPDCWFVLAVEGSTTGCVGLVVRPATAPEITAATGEPVPQEDEEEPGVAEARMLIGRALRLLGEPDSHRSVVETLCVARDALGRGRDAA